MQSAQIPEPQVMEVDEPQAHVMSANDQVVIPQDIPLPPERTPEPPEEVTKDQTTLVENEAEAFALEPLDITGALVIRVNDMFFFFNYALDSNRLSKQFKPTQTSKFGTALFNDLVQAKNSQKY